MFWRVRGDEDDGGRRMGDVGGGGGSECRGFRVERRFEGGEGLEGGMWRNSLMVVENVEEGVLVIWVDGDDLVFEVGLNGGVVGEVGVVLVGGEELGGMGVKGVVVIVLGIGVREGCGGMVEGGEAGKRFVYMFWWGFFGGGLGGLVWIGGVVGVLWVEGLLVMGYWVEEFVGYVWVMMFGEGFMKGMVVRGVVVLWGEWVERFKGRG